MEPRPDSGHDEDGWHWFKRPFGYGPVYEWLTPVVIASAWQDEMGWRVAAGNTVMTGEYDRHLVGFRAEDGPFSTLERAKARALELAAYVAGCAEAWDAPGGREGEDHP